MHSSTGAFVSPRPNFATADEHSRDRSPSLTFAQQDTRHLYPTKLRSGDVAVHEAVSARGHMHGPRDLTHSPGEISPGQQQQQDIGADFPSSSPASPTFPFPPTASEPYHDPYERHAQTMPRSSSGSGPSEFGHNSFSSASESQLSPRSLPKSRFPMPFRGNSKDRARRPSFPTGPDAEMERSESASLVQIGRAHV